MLAGYKRKANIGAAVWFVSMGVLLYFITNDPDMPNVWDGGETLIQALVVINGIAWFFALWAYVKAKGRSGFWAVLGVLQLVGLIAIAMLKDKHPE